MSSPHSTIKETTPTWGAIGLNISNLLCTSPTIIHYAVAY